MNKKSILLRLRIIREWIDYFLPWEVMGVMVLVFSSENVIEILFTKYMPLNELYGWSVIVIFSIIVIGVMGLTDEDVEEVEQEVDEIEEEIEEIENGD